MNIKTTQQFVDAFGGARVLSGEIGVSPEAVYNAIRRRRVPIRWTLKLAKTIKRKRIKIDPALFEGATP
jgi:hypothetical protein